MTTSHESALIAFAISTICIWLTESVRVFCATFTLRFSFCMNFSVSFIISRTDKKNFALHFSLPRKAFCAMLSSGTSANS